MPSSLFAVLLAVALEGCADEEPTAEDTDVFCDGAPVTTWDNFGHGFLIGDCDACHAATAANRHDAPDDVVFDTEAQVASYAPVILAVATGDSPTMPPEGGV